MKKLTKTQVRKQLRKGLDQTVYMIPSKCSLNSAWVQPHEYNPSKFISSFKELDNHFNRQINEFSYYNCNSELGNSIHYYMDIENN